MTALQVDCHIDDQFKNVDECLDCIDGDLYFKDFEEVMKNWVEFAKDQTKAKIFLERMEKLKEIYQNEVFKEIENIFNSTEIIEMTNAKEKGEK